MRVVGFGMGSFADINNMDASYVISRKGFFPLRGLPCTSEFFCWPLRRLTMRMRSQYTPIYYRKSPVPSIELSNIAARSTYNSVCHLLSCPRSSRLRTCYSQIPLDHRATSRTAHNGRASVLITCINCLHTASSAQDFSTMLHRHLPRVTTTTPPRRTDAPNSPSLRLLPQRPPFILPTF